MHCKMKQINIQIIIHLHVIFFSCLFGGDFDYVFNVYDQIENLGSPTIEDYKLIQAYLTIEDRPFIERLQDYAPTARAFRIIGDSQNEFPESSLLAVNCENNSRENCIVLYASFNQNYPKGLRRQIELILSSDFKGHILYHLGGWPDLGGGSLSLVHVPYAFKACILKEAKALGFKRVLWIDSSIVPVANLNLIFYNIMKKGYLIMGSRLSVGPFTNEEAAAAFGMTLSETFQVPRCIACALGVDFTNKIGNRIAEEWYLAARHPTAYYSSRPEENALAIILYQLGISDELIDISRIAFTKEQKRGALFFMDRAFVHTHF